MSWSDLAIVSDLVGGLGVIVSLIYVSRQIRQNTRAIRMGNATTAQTNFQQLARFLYEDREGCALVLRAMDGTANLTPAERLSAYAYFFDFMKTAELAYHQFLQQDLDEGFWNASLAFYKAYFRTPGFREYWSTRRGAFMPEFQVAMDAWHNEQDSLQRPDKLVATMPQ